MAEPTTSIRRNHCGALLKGAGKRTLVQCEFCGTEQSLRADDRDDDEEQDADAPDSEPWVEDAGEDEGTDEPDDGKPLENAECIALLHRHLEDVADDYEVEELGIEVDEENTDDERVYLYVKDTEGEVLDYFLVDRDDGTLEVYDYDTDLWDEV